MTRFVESTITFPYKRSLGPVVGAFMTALTEKRILGIRSGQSVLVPPMEWDPATGAELRHEFVEVGPTPAAPSRRRPRPVKSGEGSQTAEFTVEPIDVAETIALLLLEFCRPVCREPDLNGHPSHPRFGACLHRL